MSQIAVIGSGTMGNGIAHAFAQSGFNVYLFDISEAALQKALQTISANIDRQITKQIITEQSKQQILQRIKPCGDLKTAVGHADLVIEAATETEVTKLEIFKAVDQYAPLDAVLASNTSSISITKIASVTRRPDKVIGMHFMNPVPVMKLVEIINGYATGKGVTEATVQWSKKLGKIPCIVHDYPGFVSNRILMPMINEAIYSLFEGVAGVEEIDTVMKLGMAHPMGPLQLADFIGLDVCLSIMNVLHEGFGNPKYAPCPLLKNMVAAHKLGIKSGEGFYEYRAGEKRVAGKEGFF